MCRAPAVTRREQAGRHTARTGLLQHQARGSPLGAFDLMYFSCCAITSPAQCLERQPLAAGLARRAVSWSRVAGRALEQAQHSRYGRRAALELAMELVRGPASRRRCARLSIKPAIAVKCCWPDDPPTWLSSSQRCLMATVVQALGQRQKESEACTCQDARGGRGACCHNH